VVNRLIRQVSNHNNPNQLLGSDLVFCFDTYYYQKMLSRRNIKYDDDNMTGKSRI
jgi:hypothetical protein